jgi:predicted  nucleic acid-binding Zn-ribbon protein
MDIFWGDVSNALESAVDGWETYSFRRSEHKDSFSQALFRAMGLPELRSDTDSNITMHQLLRLMFVDQLTPPDALMSEEPFDSPFIRQSVGDYLLGLFDDALYRDQMKLKQLQKSSEDLKTRISTLVEAFSDLEQESDISVLGASIKEKQDQLDRIAVAIDAANLTVDKEVAAPDDSAELQQSYQILRNQYARLNESIDTISVEIEDSEQFIEELSRRSVAVEESLQMRDALGSVEVQVCPNCLQKLNLQHDPNDCRLCGQPWPKDLADGQRLRMQQELALQIRESSKLLEDKRHHLTELKREIPSLRSEAKKAYARFSESLSKTKTKRDSELDQLFEKRGSLENDLTYLLRFQKSAATFAQLKDASTKQAAEIRELQMAIEMKKRELAGRGAAGFQAISKVAAEFLRADIPSEELFEEAKEVTVDFSKNTFAVDGLNQFSASSMTLLKNSVHFAFLFASLELEFFRFPRLIICDNVEDKGMVPERSQNFQRLVVERSSAAEFEHQIIFTTSMIDPSLDDTELCVGEKYDHDHKSLKI